MDKGSVLVECLERSFEALMRHSSFTTQSGKTSARKTLAKLEKELIARLGPDAGDQEIGRHVSAAIANMTEGMKTARLASEYTRKLKSLESSEKKILRFIKSQGLDRVKRGDLEKHLADGGMDVSGWHKILARSAMLGREDVAPMDGEEESEKAVGNLAALLTELDRRIAQEKWNEDADGVDRLTSDLKEVNEQVNSLAGITAGKIRDLISAVNSDLDEIDAHQRLTQLAGGGPPYWSPKKETLTPFIRPDYVKFLGDGAMYLWTFNKGDRERAAGAILHLINRLWNLKLCFANVLAGFADDVPVAEIPRHLRMGFAAGAVHQINYKYVKRVDYIGYCINLASRLQSYCRDLGFTASARVGFSQEQLEQHGYMRVVATKLRGFPKEIVIVDRKEFDALPEALRENLFEPIQTGSKA